MFERAIDAIISSSDTSSIYVGCDSIVKKHENGRWYAKYTTVVIIHMDSCKGGKIFYEDRVEPDYKNIMVRMMNEAMFASEVALLIAPFRGKRHMEVHLDINGSPEHKSNVAVKQALGYVRGVTGFDAKIKPYAFAASRAADQCVKNKLGAILKDL